MAEVETHGVEGLLATARQRVERFEPEEAWAAVATGEALIVDLRSSDERRKHGIVPGSLHVPRSVLEWRADQASEWRSPHLAGRDVLILLCAEGYSSSLAAASLLDLGYERAADVVGGFEAWRKAGLPVATASEPDRPLPGMDAPAPRSDIID